MWGLTPEPVPVKQSKASVLQGEALCQMDLTKEESAHFTYPQMMVWKVRCWTVYTQGKYPTFHMTTVCIVLGNKLLALSHCVSSSWYSAWGQVSA